MGDCTLRAIAKCFDLDYNVVHKMCKKKGRKGNSGFDPRKLLKAKRGKSCMFMGRRIGYHTNQHITIARFKKLHPEGRYLIVRSGHALCLIDGVIHNEWNLNCRIQYYFYISNKINASESKHGELANPETVCQEAQSIEASNQQLDSERAA